MTSGRARSVAGSARAIDTIAIGPDVGPAQSGGAFTLVGGFWSGGANPDCPGDVDHSGAVEFDDLPAVLAAWGACRDCPADVNADGFVDFDDLLIVLANWGPC